MTARKIVVAVMVAGFLVPFIFMRTLFPFYRFGMFAEPVKGEAFEEKFEITYKDGEGELQFFYAPDVGLNARSFEYLKRNYYYRGESEKLLEVVSGLHEGKTNNWTLFHLRQQDFQPADTLDSISLP